MNFSSQTGKVQNEQKLFQCNICDKNFLKMSTLNRHIAFIHAEKCIEKCEICDKEYPKRSSLKLHIKSIHEKRNHSGAMFPLNTFS